jgi:phosphoglycerate dehydrogenase-like enzyme
MKLALGTLHSDKEFVAELRSEFPTVEFRPSTSDEEEQANIRDADAFWGNPSRELLQAAERLRWLQSVGTGVENIVSIPEVRESDVILTNCRGPHAEPMADHVFGMVTTLAHKLNEMWDDQREHRWETAKYNDRHDNLYGSTMGILALGDIGKAIARRAHGFGMTVNAVDRYPKRWAPIVSEVWELDRLDELLSISDWFVIAAPLTPETRGLVDRRRVALIKEGAYVIVISRGNIMDEDALIDGLRSGRIAGAGLDVTAVEPLPDSSPLWDMKNVLLSPHASAMTPTQWSERLAVMKENLRRHLAGEPFLHVVDKTAGF